MSTIILFQYSSITMNLPHQGQRIVLCNFADFEIKQSCQRFIFHADTKIGVC